MRFDHGADEFERSEYAVGVQPELDLELPRRVPAAASMWLFPWKNCTLCCVGPDCRGRIAGRALTVLLCGISILNRGEARNGHGLRGDCVKITNGFSPARRAGEANN